MDLINRTELTARIEDSRRQLMENSDMVLRMYGGGVYREVMEIVEASEPVDVLPKITARWVLDAEAGDQLCSYYTCSRCGRRTRVPAGSDVAALMPFCHCGACMEVMPDEGT